MTYKNIVDIIYILLWQLKKNVAVPLRQLYLQQLELLQPYLRQLSRLKDVAPTKSLTLNRITILESMIN